MAKSFTPEFNKRIRKVVDSFNNKVERQQAKAPTSTSIPSKVTVKGLKDAYPSQRAMEQKLKLLEAYNTAKMNAVIKVGREKVDVSRYEYESFLLNKKVAKKRLQRLIDKNIAKDKAEGRFLASHRTRSLKAQLHTIETTERNIFSAKNFFAASRVAGRYSDKREQMNQQFFENFFDMLWSNQIYAELDPDLVQEIHDMIEQNLTPEQLLEMYNSEPEISRLVEDYHLYTDSEGFAISDEEVYRARARLENLHDILPALIEKYSKL